MSDKYDIKAAEYHMDPLNPQQKDVAELILAQVEGDKNRFEAQERAMREQAEAERAKRSAEAEKKRLEAAHAESAKKLEYYKAMYHAKWIASGGNEGEFHKAWEGIRQSIIMGVIDPLNDIKQHKRSTNPNYNML